MKRPALPVLVALLAIGCASAPTRYYTLVPAATTTTVAEPADFAFDLTKVTLPAQVDQPQLIVRQAGAGVALLESEHWIAPLADEIRGALTETLVTRHGAQNVSGLAQAGRSLVRISVDVRRFDSEPGKQAVIEAGWSLRRVPDDAPAITCSSRIAEPVGPGYDALVQGHQRALARLAAAIAAPATVMTKGGQARCS